MAKAKEKKNKSTKSKTKAKAKKGDGIVKLGSRIRDRMTGFTGIVSTTQQDFNGNVRWAIQPHMKKGEEETGSYPEAIMFDANVVEYIDAGIEDCVIPPVETNIKIGQKVVCETKGIEGIVLHKAIFLNGCVHFGVQQKITPNMKSQSEAYSWVPYELLKVVEERTPVSEVVDNPPRTGGPTERMKRNVAPRP